MLHLVIFASDQRAEKKERAVEGPAWPRDQRRNRAPGGNTDICGMSEHGAAAGWGEANPSNGEGWGMLVTKRGSNDSSNGEVTTLRWGHVWRIRRAGPPGVAP
mmetsp:Transcript_56524/g.115710  ORF Transcript_56524/g.115710 Transcript_56524/m.115710 type:complete len:103 (+) Transcript_56524:1579-1887(+)